MGLLRASDGSIVSVPDEEMGHAVATGMQPVSDTEAGATTGALAAEDRGFVGKINAGATSALSGLTAGGSDILLSGLLDKGGVRQIAEDRAANPITSTVANIAGAALPALAGDYAGFTPAGKLGQLGSKIAGIGEGSGLLGRTAATVAAGSVEGAGFNAGNYLAQSALENKPLSAEGFVGAMGEGALWGGGTAGALSLAGSALQRAKALFPEHEITSAAASKVDQQATEALTSAMDDGEDMLRAAKIRTEGYKAEKAKADLEVSKQLSDLSLAQQQAKLENLQLKNERIKNLPPKAPRKAFGPGNEPPPLGGAGTEPFPGETPQLPGAPVPSFDEGMAMLEKYRTPEAPTATGHPTGDDLLAQLHATKTALDNGTELGTLSHGQVTDAGVAATNPEGAKLIQATKEFETAKAGLDSWMTRSRSQRSKAARDYAASIRPKESGYYARTPEGEGTVGLSRGREWAFRGSEAERGAVDAQTIAKLKPEERMAADDAVAQMFGKRRAPADVAAEIVAPKPIEPVAPPNPEEAIADVLTKHNGEHTDLAPDINEMAKVVGAYEEKSAALAEALGPDAPPTAAKRAADFKAAKGAADDAAAANTAKAADTIDTKLAPAEIAKTGSSSGLLGKIGDAAGTLELLGHLGHFVHGIPVVGPILSMLLKAKAILGVSKRLGGSVGHTSETVIAAKQAATRNRINAAVKTMLDTSSRGIQRAAPAIGGATAVLAHPLFAGGSKSGKTPLEHYNARMDDIARAQQPGAIQSAVSDHIKTSDPKLLDEITSVTQRKIQFLDSVSPKAPAVPPLLKGDGKPWQPTKYQIDQFSRYVKAVDDPASVFEDLARGQVTAEGAKALKTVYPALYQEAQTLLVQNAMKLDNTLPYARRVSLSVLFGVPVDNTMTPSHMQFLSSGVNSQQQPSPQTPASQPPTPGITGPVNVGQRTMNPMDRRAGA